MLGDIFEKSEHKEVASVYYGQIVKNYPLSSLAPGAKNKLVAFKVPVPQPDPKAVAWMTAEQNAPRQHDGLMKRPLALVRSGPHSEMVASAKTGAPNLEPEADNTSATDVLSGGNRSQLGGAGGGAANTAVVETVTPGTPATVGSAPPAEEPAPNRAEGATPPAAGSEAAKPSEAAPSSVAPAPSGAPAGGTPTPASTDANGSAAAPATAEAAPSGETKANADESSSNADGSKTDGQSSTGSTDSKDQKESSSKKKKGLRKVIPW
jgi:hypothetical protein